jgi:xanthine dehydrogenase accessory factor
MRRRTLDKIIASRSSGASFALVTDLKTGQQSVVQEATIEGEFGLDEAQLAAARKALAADKSGVLDETVFIQVINPPPRLFIVGAVHIAQALVPLASIIGYAVTVIDPRRAFATDSRFPEVTLVAEWPDDAMAKTPPDRRTAIVTLTHDPKVDDPALISALRSPAFYIGALGSRKTHAKRTERLMAQGFTAEDIARIHAPVGLKIGAVTASEIAASILGELVSVRRMGAAETPGSKPSSVAA